MSTYEIISTIALFLLGVFSYNLYKRNVLNEKKYKELMELKIKIHDITNRADYALENKRSLIEKDYDRLIYFTRYEMYGRNGVKIFIMIKEYQIMWKKISNERIDQHNTGEYKGYNAEEVNEFIKKSKNIRKLADNLLV